MQVASHDVNAKKSGMILVATIHFSPFTGSFHRLFRRLFTVVFCSETGKSTQSLLCSLFTIFTGECDPPHVYSLFMANGSSECSSIHMSVGVDQHKSKSVKTNTQTNLRKGGEWWRDARGSFQSQITQTITIHFLLFTANGSLITPITFTHSLRSRELWPLRAWCKESLFVDLAMMLVVPSTKKGTTRDHKDGLITILKPEIKELPGEGFDDWEDELERVPRR